MTLPLSFLFSIAFKKIQEGWPDKWRGQTSNGWTLGQLGNECARDLQGPLNLERQTGLQGSRFFECIDVHWMKYHDGACNWKDMVDNQESRFRNNFHIRRHALTVASPLGNDGVLDCPNGFGGHFPQLDYSKGYPDWWFLSHMDIKTPAEWLQDGVRYDGQINYAQFYERDYTTQDPNGPLKRVRTQQNRNYTNVYCFSIPPFYSKHIFPCDFFCDISLGWYCCHLFQGLRRCPS